MRPYSFVVYVLLLSLILTKTQGIRLGKAGSLTTVHQQQKQQGEDEKSSEMLKKSKRSGGVVCKDEEECTGNIKNRKLVTTTSVVSTPPTTISKQNVMKNGGNSRNDVKVNNEAGEIKVHDLQQQQEQHNFPDLDDIVEMDYSPARRKPPIHN